MACLRSRATSASQFKSCHLYTIPFYPKGVIWAPTQHQPRWLHPHFPYKNCVLMGDWCRTQPWWGQSMLWTIASVPIGTSICWYPWASDHFQVRWADILLYTKSSIGLLKTVASPLSDSRVSNIIQHNPYPTLKVRPKDPATILKPNLGNLKMPEGPSKCSCPTHPSPRACFFMWQTVTWGGRLWHLKRYSGGRKSIWFCFRTNPDQAFVKLGFKMQAASPKSV